MSRSFSTEAIILKTSAIGEIHAGVQLLTRERGLVQAIAHGARSAHGSLRSACQGFNCGVATIYHDPVKQSTKLQDFAVREQFEKIKGDLSRTLYASFWAELFWRVHQDAEWEFLLLRDALTLLEGGAPPQQVSIQVLIRHLNQSGIGPDLTLDARTGRPLAAEDWTRLAAGEDGLVVAPPGADVDGRLDPGARHYLIHTSQLPLNQAVVIGLSGGSRQNLHRGLMAFAESQFNVTLQSKAMLA